MDLTRRASLGQDQGVAAGSLRDKARPKDFETRFLEPVDVGRTIRVAPVHRGTKPVVFSAGPGSGTHSREQVTAGSEPAVDALEDGWLFFQRDMDDGIERDDGGKAPGGKAPGCKFQC